MTAKAEHKRKSVSNTVSGKHTREQAAAVEPDAATISLSGRPLVRLERKGQPLDPSITEEQISILVDRFYARIRQHERLADLFASGMSQEWPDHLSRMKAFWRSMLMQTREYDGRPVPAHVKMQGLQPSDFADWLVLFRETVREICTAEAAALYISRAETIAKSLQMAVFLKGYVAPAGAFENGVMTEKAIGQLRQEVGLGDR